MSRDRASAYIGTAGFALVVIAAMLYGTNAPQRTLMLGSLAVGSAALAVFVVLNLGTIAAFARRRSARRGANTLIMIVLFTTIVVIVQALSARHAYRYDLTANQRFSLAEQTLQVLNGLDADVYMTGFYQKGTNERERVKDLVGQYAHHTERVRFEFIDPDQKPQAAASLGITSYNTLVVQYGNKTERLINVTEEVLTNGILKLTRDETKIVYFVVGHGERKPEAVSPFGYSILRDAIEKENYIVRTVNLFDEESVPEDCAVLVVAGPTRDYFEAEIEKIEMYLAKGNNAAFLLDAKVDIPNLVALAEPYGIVVNNNVIVDPYNRVFSGEATVPVVAEYEVHPITLNFDIATIYPVARSISLADPIPPGSKAQYLAKSGKSAWGESDLEMVSRGQAVRDETDEIGPVGLAAIGSRRFSAGSHATGGEDESQIVVFGDSDFVDNRTFRLAGNADLLLNVINYLAEEKDQIAIRARRGLGDRLFLTDPQRRLVFLVSVLLVPLSVLGLGVSVFVQQRRKG